MKSRLKQKMFVLLNHSLTQLQCTQIHHELHVDQIVSTPEPLRRIWSGIKPEGNLNTESFQAVIDWLQKETATGDYLLVQGEAGATFYMVDFAFKTGLQPIYATTSRQVSEQVVENETVTKTAFFKHVTFRPYRRYDG